MDETKIVDILTENFTDDPVEHGDEGGMSPYIDTQAGTSSRSQTSTSDAVVTYWYAESRHTVVVTVAEIDGDFIDEDNAIILRLAL